MLTAAPADRRAGYGLALLRAILGVVFMAHGAQKLFVYGVDGVSGAFARMGVPLPGITGPLVGGLELLGGAALVLGLFSRVAAAGLAVDMLGAMLLVHLPQGFFLPGGIEFVLMLFGGAAAIAVAGPGAFALEGRLRRSVARPMAGLTHVLGR